MLAQHGVRGGGDELRRLASQHVVEAVDAVEQQARRSVMRAPVHNGSLGKSSPSIPWIAEPTGMWSDADVQLGCRNNPRAVQCQSRDTGRGTANSRSPHQRGVQLRQCEPARANPKQSPPTHLRRKGVAGPSGGIQLVCRNEPAMLRDDRAQERHDPRLVASGTPRRARTETVDAAASTRRMQEKWMSQADEWVWRASSPAISCIRLLGMPPPHPCAAHPAPPARPDHRGPRVSARP